MFYWAMTDRPASWRMPPSKQMEKMAAVVGRNVPPKPGLAPDDDLPPEYWQALLDDPRPEARSGPSGGAPAEPNSSTDPEGGLPPLRQGRRNPEG
jgi:hypothetical protein